MSHNSDTVVILLTLNHVYMRECSIARPRAHAGARARARPVVVVVIVRNEQLFSEV